jgi:3-hydroxy-9,10-secoandrosta-1,3,5(10)-triene-9,17-dione monooxygenase
VGPGHDSHGGSAAAAGAPLLTEPLLERIRDQAERADQSRDIDPSVIAAIKSTDLMVMAATKELGGAETSVGEISQVLAAIATACGSTAWCLWNHLAVFHLYCSTLGPANADVLRGIVARHEWVSFPGGAGSRTHGRIEGDEVVLNGRGGFGTSARYGEWVAIAFSVLGDDGEPFDPPDLRFTIVRTDDPGVTVEPTWDGMSLRASATDTAHYADVRVPLGRCASWYGVNRAGFLREPTLAVIADRYRDDWVGLADIWLADMACAVAQAALDEAAGEIRTRRAIMSAAMTGFDTVMRNVGDAAGRLLAARGAVDDRLAAIDARLAAGHWPTDADEVGTQAVAVAALEQADTAMRLLLRTLGGTALRESGTFERRWRDLQAMTVHINAHPDRVHVAHGRHLLGLEPGRF